MDEDMQIILDYLLPALQQTRGGRKIVSLAYAVEPGRETVTITFQSGGTRRVVVTGDSGVAMIYEVIRAI